MAEWGVKMSRFLVIAGALFFLALNTHVRANPQDCGTEDGPCEVGELTYRVVLPQHPQNAPSVIYLHGYAATADSALKLPNLADAFTSRGIAVIAPNGQVDVGNPKALDWGVHDGHRWPRDDLRALGQIKKDAVERFGLNPDRILLAGYSRGGSLVWDKACSDHTFATAYASASGAFWEPMWRRCSGPVHLHHSHGYADRTVPLEGRFVIFGGWEFEQGSVMKSIEILTRTNGCGQMADKAVTDAAIWEKRWTNCDAGSLVLALGPHGHGRQTGWADSVAEWFLNLPATQ
ncbi:polyhydroxybutyrate depolymerase [Ruegeria sp. 2205SS24-7]|uniref:alpha/beta hydrolase family esterase n=1 Tax=Ruegeria discodermiae TaxID=3064389 RepID=UPI0027419317|nr:polyhydroxybutyrate depolymerase [Ruegeria sp. 2205SS24-7]MDP5218149.1 polyhydroxybutyrate depolymerase [Ruegeria sp. 2205SS24-7]